MLLCHVTIHWFFLSPCNSSSLEEKREREESSDARTGERISDWVSAIKGAVHAFTLFRLFENQEEREWTSCIIAIITSSLLYFQSIHWNVNIRTVTFLPPLLRFSWPCEPESWSSSVRQLFSLSSRSILHIISPNFDHSLIFSIIPQLV